MSCPEPAQVKALFVREDSPPIASTILESLTHIIIGSAVTGRRSSLYDFPSLKHVESWKEKQPHLRVLLSIGASPDCRDLRALLKNPEKHQNFVKNAVYLVDSFSLDGIDIFLPKHIYTLGPAVSFIQRLRKSLDHLFRQNAKHLSRERRPQLSLSFPGYSPDYYRWRHYSLDNLVDLFHVRAYNLTNEGMRSTTKNHRKLLRAYRKLPINPAKQIMAMPQYGMIDGISLFKGRDDSFANFVGDTSLPDEPRKTRYTVDVDKLVPTIYRGIHNYISNRGFGGQMWYYTKGLDSDDLLEASSTHFPCESFTEVEVSPYLERVEFVHEIEALSLSDSYNVIEPRPVSPTWMIVQGDD